MEGGRERGVGREYGDGGGWGGLDGLRKTPEDGLKWKMGRMKGLGEVDLILYVPL